MPITSTHIEYTGSKLERWKRNRAACSGQDAIKDLRTVFLPDDNEKDLSEDARSRYSRLLLRSTWMPVSGYTKQGLIGMVMRLPPAVELPNQIDYALENANGAGLSLDQVAKQCLAEVIEVGRVGLLVDYPQAPAGLSAEAVSALGLSAKITIYKAESIDNWKLQNIGGTLRLAMVKLCEYESVEKDEYTVDSDKRYRVLRMVDGVYTQTLYNEKEEQIGDVIVPRQANGAAWDHIPFHVIGAETNSLEIDDALISGIVDLNTSHYQMTADENKNLHIHCGGTLVLSTEYSHEQWTQFNPNGVTVGADQGLHVGANGKAEILQLDPAQAVSKKLERLESQMVAVGAHIITDVTKTETAEAARIDASGKSSALSTAVGNVSEGIEAALEDMARFMGADQADVKYQLNQKFYPDNLDPQTIMAMIQLIDRQVIAVKDAREKLRGSGLIAQNRTDEEIDSEVGDIEPIIPVSAGVAI